MVFRVGDDEYFVLLQSELLLDVRDGIVKVVETWLVRSDFGISIFAQRTKWRVED